MQKDIHLFNATVVGENPESAFIVLEGNRLHAVELAVADLKKDQSNPKIILPLMREGLNSLVQFAQGKVPPHFTEIQWEEMKGQSDEQARLVHAILNIYSHLPHHDRMHLSSLIHHRQQTAALKRR